MLAGSLQDPDSSHMDDLKFLFIDISLNIVFCV